MITNDQQRTTQCLKKKVSFYVNLGEETFLDVLPQYVYDMLYKYSIMFIFFILVPFRACFRLWLPGDCHQRYALSQMSFFGSIKSKMAAATIPTKHWVTSRWKTVKSGTVQILKHTCKTNTQYILLGRTKCK